MADDKTITALPEITTVASTDLVTVCRPGDPPDTANKKVTYTNFTTGGSYPWTRSGTDVILVNAGDDVQFDSSGGIQFGASGQNINEFSIDGTLVGNSDTALPTEKAVKTYVDGHSGNNMWTRTGTDITLTNAGDTVQFDATGGIQFGASGQNIIEFSIDGTMVGDSDTAVPTEKAVKTYVDSQVGGVDEFSELTDVTGAYTTAGALYKVNATPDGLQETTTILSEPSANQFTLTRGTSALAVQASATIDQDLQTTAYVDFNTVTVSQGGEAAPSFAIGDGDTGFYESTDDTLNVSIGGVSTWAFTSAIFYATAASGAYIMNETASATNPVFAFGGDSDTGIGHAGANQLSLIANSVEALRINDAAAHSVAGIANYETLVTNDDDIPNKKYVDDQVGGVDEFSELTDVTGAYTTAGALYNVNATPNGLQETTTLLSEPAANQFTLTRGTSALAIQTSATIDQDLQATADVEFNSINVGIGLESDPSISFGDGDTGFYEYADDIVALSIAGTTLWGWTTSCACIETVSGPSMMGEAATSTNPVWSFVDDEDTGIGLAGANQLSLIAGAVEGIRVNSAAAHSVAGIANYETLVTNDDDIPNKKYIDDAISGHGDHLLLSNLTTGGTDGDAGHSQMVLRLGRTGGQVIYGGTASSDDLELGSTTDTTKGAVKIISGNKYVTSCNPSIFSVVAATGITPVDNEVIPVESSTAGDTTITANPQFEAGTDGQFLTLIGTSDTKTVTINEGNGISLNGGTSITLGNRDLIEFVFYNSTWYERCRKQ